MKFSKFLVIYYLGFILFIGCEKTEEVRWKHTDLKNTIDAYKEFLEKYPSGQHADTARARTQLLYFQNAKNINKVPAFEQYLREYPNGKFAEEAENCLKKFKIIKIIVKKSDYIKGVRQRFS